VTIVSASTPSRARNPRGQGARLREEIVAAALRLVDRGVSPLTLRAVAREAGIAAPSIYDHFTDVSQILAAVSAGCLGDLDRAMLAARAPLGDPVDRLEAICHAYLDWAGQHPERYALAFALGLGPEAPDVRGAAVFATVFASLGECVRAMRSGSRDTYGDAVALWAGLHGLAGLRAGDAGFAWPDQAGLERKLVWQLGRLAG